MTKGIYIFNNNGFKHTHTHTHTILIAYESTQNINLKDSAKRLVQKNLDNIPPSDLSNKVELSLGIKTLEKAAAKHLQMLKHGFCLSQLIPFEVAHSSEYI